MVLFSACRRLALNRETTYAKELLDLLGSAFEVHIRHEPLEPIIQGTKRNIRGWYGCRSTHGVVRNVVFARQGHCTVTLSPCAR